MPNVWSSLGLASVAERLASDIIVRVTASDTPRRVPTTDFLQKDAAGDVNNTGILRGGNLAATNGGVLAGIRYLPGQMTQVIGEMYSSGKTLLGYGVKSSTTAADTFVSSVDNAAWTRGALVVGNDLRFMSAAAQATAVGSVVTMTDRLIVDVNGSVLIGQSVAGYVNANGLSLEPFTGRGLVSHATGTASGALYAGYGYAGAQIGSITQSGTTGVAYNTTSDRRLKCNIQPSGDAGAIIDQIEIVAHDWKAAPEEHVAYGVIAQDLHLVAPQAVTPGDDDADIDQVWQVDLSKLVPLLVKEIQSLRGRVAELEGR